MTDGADLEHRVEALLARLPIGEKVALMFHTMAVIGDQGDGFEGLPLPSLQTLLDLGLTHFNLLGPSPDGRDFADWANGVQRRSLQRPHPIPVTFSTDPRHHFTDNPLAQMMAGAYSRWPEPLGLAAIGSAERVREFADIARQEYLAVGLRVALHPQIDLATEARWPRINATFGEDGDLTSRLGAAYVEGLQGDSLSAASVAAMIKHFPGGGAQRDGNDPHFAWGREQVYPGGAREYHLRPFRSALAAGAAEVMPYYGMPVGTDWEEVGFGFNRSVITGVLREELGFDGVVCTDWGLITDNPGLGDLGTARAWGVEHLDRHKRMLKVLDAGVDQFGGEHCTDVLLDLVADGRVSEARIDESARRLLRVKFALGLFDEPFVDPEHAAVTVGRADFVAAGRRAQQDALTLLTNGTAANPLLPLPPGIRLYAPELSPDDVAGRATLVDDPKQADVALLRLATPYRPAAPGIAAMFHHGSLEFAAEVLQEVGDVCAAVPTIIDVYLERPAVLTPIVDSAGAIIANFGVAADALVEVLFGESAPRGSLPFDLPRSDAAVVASRSDVAFDTADPVFRFGHGLRYR
ncbi:glycoside hydrolase family 3 protein [Mycolicibacterium arseniciresistens]|uniref:beta-glucosidase n=1 Tax=Mycolicibacterium arseniciresistens TaxID=3062257 RepID=A0ABT8UEA8_9MYCO|nr:glycoside hydrolase family 3 N-terminal domain-containing protein [Mycolicibacterium arseniciresistens]MDO3636125.1 glycoside hydrolase family 3 N-terminal domain-containing protein [Mycolicibacterium arseniciresistens]